MTHFEQHDDDQPIGRVLTRREMLALLGGAGAALLVGSQLPGLATGQGTPTPQPTITPAPTATGTPLPGCIVRPALAEGPFFFDERLRRADIRTDPYSEIVKDGVPLHLAFNVSDVSNGTCKPLQGAFVDVWHCDAEGVYSNVSNAAGEYWLRGYQVTDANGVAGFTTIYPGWYPGRAVHIHFKIRTDPDSAQGYDFTSQMFFPEDWNARVHTDHQPYAQRGLPNVPNERDFIFQGSDDLLTLDLHENEDGSVGAIFGVGLDLARPVA